MAHETDGFPITSLREIKFLQKLDHPNIIELREVSVGYKQNNVFLVFDYYETDLANLVDKLVSQNEYLSLADIKTIMMKLFKAVEYLHRNEIIHRDLKISNILVNKDGDIRVADFGLARELGPEYKNFTKKVVTLWYRAPEILLG
jgi:serine/threonine protein kinase